MTDSSPTTPTLPDLNPIPTDDEHLQRTREAAKRVILFTVFLDILGFGIIIPQLGIYAAQFGASAAVVGVLAATYSTMGFLFAPFWGRLSDRIGRRPVLLWSIFGTAVGYVIFAFSGSLAWLFAARIIDGITSGNISTAQAYLADVTPPAERSKTFGIFGAIFGIGFAIGPFIGAQLSHLPGAWGANLGVGVFTAVLCSINWLLAFKRLPETLTPEERATNRERHASQNSGRWQLLNIHGFRRAFALPGLNLLLAVSFFSMLAFATLQGTFTFFLIAKFVRPTTQAFIQQNPDAAAQEALRHIGRHQESRAPVIGFGSEAGEAMPSPAAPAQGPNVTPYTPALGGDFTLPDRAPPAPDLSWRRVEQILVQPRAAQVVNWLFTTIGVLALVVQGGMIGPLKRRFGDVNLILVGTLMMAAGLALIPVPHEFMWQFPVVALLAIGNGISAPVLTALVSLLSPEAERGEIIGVFQSTQSLGRMIGPVIGGVLFEDISRSAPYFAGGLIMLFAFFLSLNLRGRYTETLAVNPST